MRHEEAARRLMSIPGISVLNATALIAAIGQGESFARGRDLAAWLGLVPRQVTTGGKPRLVGISSDCRHDPPRLSPHPPQQSLESGHAWSISMGLRSGEYFGR